MALVLDDRVRETSTTTGTGTLNLDGAVDGFQTFVAGVGNSNTTYYAIVNRSETEWELGLGTVTDASTDTLARTTVISSSNSDSAVSFSAGTKDVFVTLPASKTAVFDTSNNFTIGTGAAGVDYTLTFNGADSDGVLTWMEDEDLFKFTDVINVGVDDTGHDVKFFGATSGSYFLWDESADSLLLTDSTPLKIGDSQDLTLYHDGSNSYITNAVGALKVATETSGIAVTIGHTTSETTIADNATITGNLSVGGTFDVTGTIDFSDSAITNAGDIQLDSITGDGDTDTAITFSGSNVITVKAANADQVTFTDGAIVPSTDDDIDLGTNSTEFKDAYFDGTVTTDGLTVSSTTNLDGAIQVDNTITVGVDDTGYDVKFFGDTASAYMLWDTSADDLVFAGAAGIDLAGDIDVDGTANLDNTDIDGTLAVDGTTISLDATTSLNIDNSNTSNGITIGTATSGVPISIGHATSEVTINDNLTVTGTLTLGSNAELTEAELEMLDGITAGTVAASKAVVVDSNKDAASFRNVTLTGELDAATLDISGNADIAGTTNLDAVDIDGNVQIDGTVTVGVDDTGLDVKFFGATSGSYALWDESADSLLLTDSTPIKVGDAQDMTLYHDGTNSYITNKTGALKLATETSGIAITIGHTTSEVTVADNLTVTGDFTVSGTTTTVDSTTVNLNDHNIVLDSGNSTSAVVNGGGITLEGGSGDDATFTYSTTGPKFELKLGSSYEDLKVAQLIASSLDIDGTITVGVDNTGYDVKFFGATSGKYMEWDESADQLDVAGSLDVTGNTSMVGTLTVGVDDTGHDVKFFGATSGAYMLWDESTDDLVLAGASKLYLYDAGGGENISSDGTDLTIASGAKINLTATTDVVIPANVGITFGSGEKIEGDSTDLTITSGAKINLTATSDVVIPANVGITFGTGEKIEGDSTNLTITSGADIALTATADVNLPNNVGMVFGDDGEKIEGDGTDLTIASSGVLNLAAGGTTNQIKVTDGAILPITDDDVDLGSSSYQFKNAYIDGTLEADAITIGGTAVTAGGATAGFALAMAVAL